jgi:hypothetical protein
VIFTSGSTAALKLVGESYPFHTPSSRFLYAADNHNSVVGIREVCFACIWKDCACYVFFGVCLGSYDSILVMAISMRARPLQSLR